MKEYCLFFLIPASAAFLAWHNNAIEITGHNYINNKLPEAFDGFRILHVSDLHNKNFHGRLIDKIKKINPDIIVITGDLIDRRRTNLNAAEKFIEAVMKIAPSYYVSGNHEELSKDYTKLKEILHKYKVVNMDDSYIEISKKGSKIGLTGLAAPVLIKIEKEGRYKDNDSYLRNELQNLSKNFNSNFNMLIAHRPEQIDIYKEFNFDLVFSGHAHGGK